MCWKGSYNVLKVCVQCIGRVCTVCWKGSYNVLKVCVQCIGRVCTVCWKGMYSVLEGYAGGSRVEHKHNIEPWIAMENPVGIPFI